MATPVQLVLRADYALRGGQARDAARAVGRGRRSRSTSSYNAEVMKIERRQGCLHPDAQERRDGRWPRRSSWRSGRRAIRTCSASPATRRCVQYQLDDPAEYIDENIIVIGGGDAGIENALGLIADPEQKNVVSLINRDAGFPFAKSANVSNLMAAKDAGRITTYVETTTTAFEDGCLVADTPNGPVRVPVDRVIARMGSAPPRDVGRDRSASSSPRPRATPIRRSRRSSRRRSPASSDRRARRLSADQALHEPGL